jgi:excisionase family DNA binding protein
MEQSATYLTVKEAAERLRQNEQTVRRRLREGSLPGVRVGEGARAAWRIPAAALEEMLDAEKDRLRREMFGDAHADTVAATRRRTAGMGGGYGPAGADAAADAAAAAYGLTDEQRLALRERGRDRLARIELFERVEREMAADPSVRQQLERLDEEERVEAEARELAQRIRRAERIRERALEILNEEDEH